MSAALPDGRRPPTTTTVTAGAWSFEVRGDEVADIRFDGVPLLRAVRAVVRDEDWNTIPVSVARRSDAWSEAGLRIALSLRFRGPREEGPVDYLVDLSVDLVADALTVAFEGRAASGFYRNRIGLVVLHPLSEAGRPVEHVRTDGSVTGSAWPSAISPHQPFTDVAGFRWERDGVAAELSFEGDVFETEDQRNWTDASFKTYSTPLSVPFPLEVRPGERVVQRVRLRGRSSPADGAGSVDVREPDRSVVVVGEDVIGAVPALSVAASIDLPAVPAWASDLAVDTVLTELTGPMSTWAAALAAAGTQAADLGAGLDVRVVCATPHEVAHAVSLLPEHVVRVGVFDRLRHVPTPMLWEALSRAVGERRLNASLVAGTRGHFAELNRTIAEQPAEAAGITCSITPQMHATELPHIVDSLQGQTAVARDVTRLASGRPVWLGPVTLRQRFNAVATSETATAPAPDPLQPTQFTAAWTLASIAALTNSGVTGVCFFELAGPAGLGDRDHLYPAGRVLKSIARLAGRPVLGSRAPTGVASFAMREASGTRLFLARLDDDEVSCEVQGLPGGARTVALEPWSVLELSGS